MRYFLSYACIVFSPFPNPFPSVVYFCYNLSMSHLAIFALGPLRIELDGKPIQTSRHKALALLVYMALWRDTPSRQDKESRPGKQSREALSALLWPDYEQEKAFAYLRRTLWEIRSMLGEGWLEADRAEVWFRPKSSIFLDVAEFQSHLNAVKQHAHPAQDPCQECIAHLHTVALLYRGDFLTGFSLRDSTNFEDWRFFQQEVIRRDYGSALKKLTNILYERGSFTDAIMFSQRWLALDTLNEEAHCQLMKIYAANGQRHLALRQYQQCTQVLLTELGVIPEPATSALNEAIVSGTFHFKGELSTAPLSNLPAPSTPFIGRQLALGQIASLLSKPGCWLLTLLGPGGIGKTRLAIEFGREQTTHFPQGIFFISLSMIERGSSIAPAIARSVGLTFRQNGPSPEEQLLDFLREKRLLLILDSFEHLIQWAGLLVKIHTYAPWIKILVTSRHRLMLQGEWVMEVNGLRYPRQPLPVDVGFQNDTIQAFSAVELFLQAARRSRVSFQPSSEDISAIVSITQLLEGMPLGLELAAAWVSTLSCQEIANEINRGIDILETPHRDISEGQRSMRAVFDHSWNLLSRREQILFPRLAVFRGNFSRQAAEQVAGISLRELSGLVDKSLVRRTSIGRFDLHDLTRQYCTEILALLPSDEQETRRRHCAFYTSRMSEWNELLRSAKQGGILREIETDLENIHAAWEWALHHQRFDYLEQAVDGMGIFYLRRARLSEGRDAYLEASEFLQAYLSAKDDNQLACLSARMLFWQAALSLNLEQFEEAKNLVQAGQTILDRPELDQQQVIPERIFGWIIQASLGIMQFDAAAALHNYRQAMLFSKRAELRCPGIFLFIWRFMMAGSVSQDLYLELERNLEYVQQSQDPFELGCHLYTLGIAKLYHACQIEIAEPLLNASIKNLKLVEDPSTSLMVLKTQGYLLLAQGKFEACNALKQHELELVQDIGDRHLIGITLAEIGEILYHLGKYQGAEDQIREGMAMLKDRSEMEYAHRHRYLGDTLLAQGKFEEARAAYLFSYHFFKQVDEKGWMLTALTGLSRVEFALGNCSAAWQHAMQALQLYREIQLYTFFVYLTLADIALLLENQGEVVQALELYHLVSQLGYLAKSRWFAHLYGKHLDDAHARLPAEEQESLKERCQTLDFPGAIQKLQ